jgi:hypothetical protein
MDTIDYASQYPGVQELIKDFNLAGGQEDSGGEFQKINDTAEALLAEAGLDEELAAELTYVMGMCDLAKAELNFATCASYVPGTSLLGQFALRQLDRLT